MSEYADYLQEHGGCHAFEAVSMWLLGPAPDEPEIVEVCTDLDGYTLDRKDLYLSQRVRLVDLTRAVIEMILESRDEVCIEMLTGAQILLEGDPRERHRGVPPEHAGRAGEA